LLAEEAVEAVVVIVLATFVAEELEGKAMAD
jgi:hypothetical protein